MYGKREDIIKMSNLPISNENDKLIDSKIKRNNLSLAIYEVIDNFSKESNYTLTYEEINSVLIQILSDNHNYQLKGMFKK